MTLKDLALKHLNEEYQLDDDQLKFLDTIKDDITDFYGKGKTSDWKIADTGAYKSLIITGGSDKLIEFINKFREKGGWVVASVQAKGSDKVFGVVEPPDDPLQFTYVPNGDDVVVSCWVVRGGRQSIKPLINKVVPDSL